MFHKIKYLSLFILNYYCYSQNCDGSITFKMIEEGKTILFNKELKGDVIYDKSKTYTLKTTPILIRGTYLTEDFKEEMKKNGNRWTFLCIFRRNNHKKYKNK